MNVILDAHNLSEAEQNLVRAAVANQGVLEIVSGTTTRGRAVVAGRTKFFDPNNRSVADVSAGSVVKTRLADGTFESEVR